MTRKIYVVGFAFSPALNSVVLIAKTNQTDSTGVKRPDWLNQKFNGIGTDFNAQEEEPTKAMERTFRERTGVNIEAVEWQQYHQLENPSSVVMFYKTVLPNIQKFQAIGSITNEPVHKLHLDMIQNPNVVSNLSWLIPMALDKSHNYSMSLDHFALKVDNDHPCILERYLCSIGAYSEAWLNFREQTHAHLEPSNSDGGGDGSANDALLMLSKKVREVRAYVTAIGDTYNLTKGEVEMICHQAATYFDEFPIDIPKALELAQYFIADVLGTISARVKNTGTVSATSTAGSSQNAGEGSSENDSEKTKEGGSEKKDIQQLPSREPGANNAPSVNAGSNDAKTKDAKAGQEPVQKQAKPGDKKS